ncbi:Pimeloyl-ACP methyl ester carboxylesterase [Lentzea xinjiangensis]|uniref:Pimeloyl-ACP methyl ester carboxylesterase n=1 Tax=Lentzea xinjiangensis TaxID=402600 RepID=A0A1H9DCP0_9PSEU|nr:alpha/beta hydrolase [Lentzea xinjiangensis]SEQ11322.1 Pimeloyl-ACP methyl ester carboxylesterase [Lentzea xinjiangensis]
MRLRRLCAAVLLASLVPTPAAAQAAPTTCQDVHTPVRFALTQQTMYGRLCVPQGATKVQVLVPGGTYTSEYWDIPVQPEVRSVRQAMNKAGIATMAVDRIGTGRSSKPLSLLINTASQAEAVHQVVQSLRPRFRKVLIGGHSVGSGIAIVEASKYRDVDGVLVTGMTNQWNYVKVLPALAGMIPVTLDPQLSRLGLDPGYLTTAPGTRYDTFHKPGPPDAGVIAYEESTKDVFAAGEAITTILMNNVVIPASRGITAPVMTAQAAADHFCGTPPLGADCSSAEALAASERPYFPRSPRVDAFVLTGYGHCFNFAPNANEYHAAVVAWQRSV